MKEKTVFLTGITGLLGANVARTLLGAHYKVKALTRKKQLPDSLTHKNLQLIYGQLDEDWRVELEKTDYFIHAAGVSNPALLNYTDYQQVNVELTKKLLQTCKKAKLKKFIYISSANTIGYGNHDSLGEESRAIREPFTHSLYARSKLEAENYVLSENSDLHTLVINPTFMIGPYDNKPSSGRIILRALEKSLLFYPKGGKNFVSVKDVSLGILYCLEKKVSSERYLLANENLSYRQFYNKLHTITNQKPLMLGVPKSLLLLVGYFGDLLRKLGIKTELSSTNMRILNIKNYYYNGKSKAVLKMEYHPIDIAISEAVKYFQHQKKFD